MEYPTREQAQDMAKCEECESCRALDVCQHDDGPTFVGEHTSALGRLLHIEADANNKANDEVNRLVNALVDMRFAYVNCDPDCPHDFEREAYTEAEEILTSYGKGWMSWGGVCDNAETVTRPDPVHSDAMQAELDKAKALIRRMAKDLCIWTQDEIDQYNAERLIITCDLIAEAEAMTGEG